MKKVLYPGSFDPIHNGHLDIARRASRLFDKFVFVVRAGGDSDEDYLIGRGTDERHRTYSKYELPKRHLRELFLHSDGSCSEFAWGPDQPEATHYHNVGTISSM